MKLRYDSSGTWYKGNSHIHSTASDGGKTFAELAELYASADYDFLFRTDHWVVSDTSRDETSYPLLWIDGIELDGRDATGAYYHVICLGTVDGICREDGLDAGLAAARAQGVLTVLAHPHWSGNSLDDAIRWSFDGVEIYNHVCHWLNGKSGGLVHWEAALRKDPDTLAFAADDAHLRNEHLGWNGGWIVVNADDCSAPAILTAIRRGNFYASCGPRLESIRCDGDHLLIKTSPAQLIRLVGPAYQGLRQGTLDGDLLTEFRMPIPEDWDYVYLEIEDKNGHRAWTNNLFTAVDA